MLNTRRLGSLDARAEMLLKLANLSTFQSCSCACPYPHYTGRTFVHQSSNDDILSLAGASQSKRHSLLSDRIELAFNELVTWKRYCAKLSNVTRHGIGC